MIFLFCYGCIRKVSGFPGFLWVYRVLKGWRRVLGAWDLLVLVLEVELDVGVRDFGFYGSRCIMEVGQLGSLVYFVDLSGCFCVCG